MPLIFVNYRVREVPGYATLLYRELTKRFGSDSVFLASSSIRAGDDFIDEVFANLRECEVMLAIIGPQWGRMKERNDVFDWVHEEIAAAFASGMRVIPVLVEDAELPDESSLPEDIAMLPRCQAVSLRHYSFEADLATLIDALLDMVPELRRRMGWPDAVADGEPVLYRVDRQPAPPCLIGLMPGSIHRVRTVDIWVNSENTQMQMARHNDFSVSAIIRYWGARRDATGMVIDDLIADELTERVGDRRPVVPGTAIVTGAGELAATNNVRHIIHVASVHGEPGAGFRQVHNIDLCVTNALNRAEEQAEVSSSVRSVLFPLFGTGTAEGAGVEMTADTVVSAVLDYVTNRPRTPLRAVYVLAYTVQELSVLRQVMNSLHLVPVAD